MRGPDPGHRGYKLILFNKNRIYSSMDLSYIWIIRQSP